MDERNLEEPSGIEEAKAARQRMEQLNDEVSQQWPEVLEVSETLYDLRKRNHFADLIMDAIKGS